MLNSNIKIDLHIHSKSSEYKDGTLVKEGTIENSKVLLDNLVDNEINMFAITDHNRFDYDLYNHFKQEIKNDKYDLIKTILPGVEFDVCIEDGKDKCHIIAIFDDKEEEKVEKINENIISIKELTDKIEVYSKKEFEDILKKINLNACLIVHQKKGIDFEGNSQTASLSEATENTEEYLKIGYFDALEYNKPSVEGMIINSFEEINLREFPMITGSDCHDWSEYPKHSKKSSNKTYITEIKALPTFKGLSIALTSPKTRLKNLDHNNNKVIDKINMPDKEILLSKGINVFIGNNGSGKSYILDIIANQIKEGRSKYKGNILNNNKIVLSNEDNINGDEIKYIPQNYIIESYKNNKIEDFEKNYENINHKEFDRVFDSYYNNIKSVILHNIELYKRIDNLKCEDLTFKCFDKKTYLSTIYDNNIEIVNEHKLRNDNLKEIISQYYEELKNNKEYYKKLKIYDTMNDILIVLKGILSSVNKINQKFIDDNRVMNLISSKLNILKDGLEDKSNTQDGMQRRYIDKKNNIKRKIIEVFKLKLNKITLKDDNIPKIISSGLSKKTMGGFTFIKKANYHNNEDILNEFHRTLFKKEYRNIEELLKIKDRANFMEAVKGSTNIDKVEEKLEENYKNFIKNAKLEEKTIKEVTADKRIINTPGERALSYYKFIIKKLKDDEKIKLLIIDQPENDISVFHLKNSFIELINSLRSDVQILLATHNPLLVVNIDPDNIIYLENIDDCINIKSGCLEYENDDYSIVNIIEDNIEGGRDVIKRRMKVYNG